MSLFSWANRISTKKPTRNERFLAALARNHSKKSSGTPASNLKRNLNRRERARIIQQEDPDRYELLEWITDIQKKLSLNDEDFGKLIGVSARMVKYYRAKMGYMPTLKVYKALLKAERLAGASVEIKKNKTSFVRVQPMHLIVIS